MFMIVMLKTARLEQWREAEAVLRVHRPDDDPMPLCAGCAEFACSYTWWPCQQARWAQRVLQEPQDGGVQL